MNERPVSPMRSFAMSLAAGGLVVIAMGQAYLRLTPVIYRSSTTIALNRWTLTKRAAVDGEAQLAAAECRELSSSTNFDEVANALHLRERWKNRVPSASPLSLGAAQNLLRLQVSIRPKSETLSFEIAATDADAKLAAEIVQTFANLYTTKRSNEIAQAVGKMLNEPKKGLEREDDLIKKARLKADDLYAKLAAERLRGTGNLVDPETYNLLQKKRDDLEAEFKNKEAEIKELRALPAPDLRQKLSTSENDRQLAGLMNALNKSDLEIAGLKNDHDPASPKMKSATALRKSLDEKIDAQLENILQAKQTRLDETASALRSFNLKLQNASTNLPAPSPLELQYNLAMAELRNVESNQDDLEKTLQAQVHRTAPLPDLKLNYYPRVLDPVEPSTLPFSPDAKVAQRATIIGIFSLICAAILAVLPPSIGKRRGDK